MSQHANLNVAGMTGNTLSITDYQLISPTLAKVVVATTGQMNSKEMAELLTAKFDGRAVPVQGSFRALSEDSMYQSHVGFVRASVEIRTPEPQELSANYRMVTASSNILMSKEDKSLWQMTTGNAGTYLARHGNEDLSELVQASVNHTANHRARLANVVMASAAKQEFVAYVNSLGDMDYGFVLASNDQKTRVVSKSTVDIQDVPNKQLVSATLFTIPQDMRRKIIAAIDMSGSDKAKQSAYYKAMFSYAPDYAQQMVDMVNESASM